MDTYPDSLDVREELHRGIVSRSPHPIFLVDVDSGLIVDSNEAMLDLLGYSRSDFEQLRYEDVDIGRTSPASELYARVCAQHHDILGDRTFRRKNGQMVPVEVSANLVIYRGKETVCFFARDISNRIEAAREQERLRRALSLSQKHEAVGRLAAGIAHDFNNQLMVMQLCAQFVRDKLDPSDPSRQDLEDLLAAGKSASGLVRQLLAFSGKQLLRPTQISVDKVIEDEEKMLRRTLGADINIETRYGAGAALTFFDRTQLEQVVLNLALNARDAMPSGGTFAIETSVVDVTEDFVEDFATLSSGPHILVTLRDTGVGMDERTLNRIFEPFFTTKRSGRGTGLGLATVYGIVKQSGGSIWATSRPGVGTIFRVYLPVVEEGADQPMGIEIPHTTDVPRGDETLLIVDDDEMVRTLAGRILRDLGYRILEAASPAEAVEIFSQSADDPETAIDLILSDVVMPGQSGPEMIKEMEKLADRVRVIFMSGYTEGRIKVDELRTQDYIFLEKPLGRSELAQAIRTYLDH